ncbi:MAG TPA: hypothetical protein VLU96_03140 [Gaiellaceae bacterium]|nr:hypothetical protein [Gaiellaceae bacterium]
MARVAFAVLSIFCALWLLGYAFPGVDRALYGHHGLKMSPAQAASFIEKSSVIENATCNTQDTNGWDYACTYTYSRDGTLFRMGVQKNGLSSGSVPMGQSLPPRR